MGVVYSAGGTVNLSNASNGHQLRLLESLTVGYLGELGSEPKSLVESAIYPTIKLNQLSTLQLFNTMYSNILLLYRCRTCRYVAHFAH